MKFVLFESGSTALSYGVLGSDGVMSLAGLFDGETPQDCLQQLIDDFDRLQPRLAAVASSPIPLSAVRLLPPVPWPGKILITTATYAGQTAPSAQLLMTLKSPESVIGPGESVRLPDVDRTRWQFVPQAGLGLVMRGPAKDVPAHAWRTAVFGYTCVIDVMARGDQQFGRDFWLAKADTLGPLGPSIVTIDEIPDPSILHVRSWQNDAAAQDFLVADASHSIPEQVEFATTVMTLRTGDVLACGSALEGQRALTDGDRVDVEIEPIGRLSVGVTAPVSSGA